MGLAELVLLDNKLSVFFTLCFVKRKLSNDCVCMNWTPRYGTQEINALLLSL